MQDWHTYLDHIAMYAKLANLFVGGLKKKKSEKMQLTHISWPKTDLKNALYYYILYCIFWPRVKFLHEVFKNRLLLNTRWIFPFRVIICVCVCVYIFFLFQAGL